MLGRNRICTIEQLSASAWQQAIEDTAELVNSLNKSSIRYSNMKVRDQIIEFCNIFELQLMSFNYDIEYGDFIFRVYPKRNSPLYRNFRISDAFSEFDEFIVEYTGFNSINNILILEFDDDAKVTQIKFSDYINKLKQELNRQGWEYVDGEWVKSMI